jgi:hypothetical protein
LELSFEANAQVSFKNSDGNMKLKRFFGKFWENEVVLTDRLGSNIEFKVFVYSPNLEKEEQLTLKLELDGRSLNEEQFAISQHNDYAGWFSIKHCFDEFQ